MPAWMCEGNPRRKFGDDLLAYFQCIALVKSYPMGYNYGMNTLNSTPEFNAWLSSLRDKVAKARIIQRLDSAALGNFGDCEPVGEGISEMRIHYGPGYRVYYSRIGDVVYLLIIGGNKSTQKRDIKKAKQLFSALGKE